MNRGTITSQAGKEKGELIMDNVGRVATGLVIAMLVVAIVVGIRSTPDMRRYYKIRQM